MILIDSSSFMKSIYQLTCTQQAGYRHTLYHRFWMENEVLVFMTHIPEWNPRAHGERVFTMISLTCKFNVDTSVNGSLLESVNSTKGHSSAVPDTLIFLVL